MAQPIVDVRPAAAGSDMCGIVLENGRDCPGYVRPEFPFNICAEHLAAVYQFGRDFDREQRKPRQCPICGRHTALPGIRGFMCSVCTYATDDYYGDRPSGAEIDQATRAFVESLPESDNHHHRPVVYYIRFGDRIKIGTSENFRKRLEALPHDEVLAVELGSYAAESRRHTQFKAERITGEWFTASPRLVLHARALMADGSTWEDRIRAWKVRR